MPHGESQAQQLEEKRKAPTRLVLVRHAVTAHTGPVLSGRMPGIDLSEKGVGQADTTAQRLAKLPIAAVYTSPIERTAQTAQRIAAHHNIDVQPLPGVVEADYGDWTGGKIADLAKTDEWKIVQVAPSRARFPNGESIREMQARTVAALDEIVARHLHETVVVVSHADPIKSAIAHYTGMHLDMFQRVHVSPASVTVFDFHAYGCMLVKCNDTGGLDDLLPEPEAPATEAVPEQLPHDAVPSVREAGIPPSSEGDKECAVGEVTEERSPLAGVPSVREAGIPPSSEGDKE